MTGMGVGFGRLSSLIYGIIAYFVANPLQHGVGNWKAILDDHTLTFAEDRTPVDLKDRYAYSHK